MPVRLKVEGLRQFNRDVRRSTDADLPKRIGRANKHIGRLVISRLSPSPDPAAVGAGFGAAVRPSATRSQVTLSAGGSHRSVIPMQTWGRRNVAAIGGARPQRPNIIGTAVEHADEISDEYLDAILAAMDGAFADTDKG